MILALRTLAAALVATTLSFAFRETDANEGMAANLVPDCQIVSCD